MVTPMARVMESLTAVPAPPMRGKRLEPGRSPFSVHERRLVCRELRRFSRSGYAQDDRSGQA
jgi:hypothetical protein